MPELKAIGRYNRLAMRAANLGQRDLALWNLSMASRLSREAGRPLLEAVTKNNMGLVFQMCGQEREASLCFHMALNLSRDAAVKQAAKRLSSDDHPLCRTIRTNLSRLDGRVTDNTLPLASNA